MSGKSLSSICRQCRTTTLQQRSFITSSRLQKLARAGIKPRALRTASVPQEIIAPSTSLNRIAENAVNESRTTPRSGADPDEPYHMNVYSHKHNTHITFTSPDRDPILSFSCGNIGLKKHHRGSFDAAYQLASSTFRKVAEMTWRVGGKKSTSKTVSINDPDVKSRGVEVILRGYGDGREAFTKALLGAEGRLVKHLISKVSDGTRLKFGGTRSRAVRRL